jgi:phosphinothricin acetyltransferase
VSRQIGYGIERLLAIDGATVSDINALIPQLKPSWKPLSEDGLVELLASESRVYVARDGRRIVGLTVMVPHRHLPGLRYHVEDVVIAAEHRGQGLARRLLEFAMQEVAGSVLSFDLRSHGSRTHAHRLYVSLGFRPSDTTVFRLEPPTDHASGQS